MREGEDFCCGVPIANGELFVNWEFDDFDEVAFGCAADEAREVNDSGAGVDSIDLRFGVELGDGGG